MTSLSDRDGSLVRLVAWNIRAGGGVRVQGIAEQLCRWGVDVAMLSEYRATPPSRRLASALATAGLTHERATVPHSRPRRGVEAPGTVATNGLLVASRWPLRAVGVRAPQPEAGRWLLLRVAAERPFAVGAMHVPNRASGRKWPFHDAVLGLARTWRAGPALFAGDTNSGRIGIDEESPAFHPRSDQWLRQLEQAGWADAFRRLHGDRREFTWYSPNAGNGFRLDEAFVNRRLQPRLLAAQHAWGLGDGNPPRRDALSDHAALIVDLEA